jgi:hypothetical protein
MDSFLKKLGMSGEYEGRQRGGVVVERLEIIDSGGLDVGSGLLFTGDDVLVENHFMAPEGGGEREEEEEGEREEEEEGEREEEEQGEGADVPEVEEKLDSGDEDESRVDKIYVISIDGVPYYYEKDLDKAKDQMLMLGNEFVKNLDDKDGTGHKLLCDFKMKKIEIIAPFAFLGLTFNRSMHELTLDYAVKIQ